MLKIIAGEFRSRRLEGPAVHDLTTRPYLQRVKESVFNILREWFDEARVLDLFAGVGTVGLEAVSRGAAEVVMVERSRPLAEILQRNIETLACANRARVWRGDALLPECLRHAPSPVDLVFVDPPFSMMEDAAGRQRVLEQIARCPAIMADSSFVVLRSPLGPGEVDLEVPGLEGPEPHRYGKGMWVLFYVPRNGAPGDGGVTAG
jgi:16S rRNA (guanine966-N2)-methyltransferase